jgi:hypothetical protein
MVDRCRTSAVFMPAIPMPTGARALASHRKADDWGMGVRLQG